jgi:uncharacterized membrane protein
MKNKPQNTNIENTEEKHPKQDFQVDRIAFFSDAVFAIVITLLVIEFKVPHIDRNTNAEELLKELADLKYNFFALLIGFFVVARLWIQHHFMFKYIHNYNPQIIWGSLAMLIPIVFFPFCTEFFAESTQNENIVFFGIRIFTLNNFLAMLICLFFYWLCFIKFKEHTYSIPTKEKIKFLADTIFSTLFSLVIFIFTFAFDASQINHYLIGMAVITLLKLPLDRILQKKLGR